ncbi:hypothetical protein MWMV17_MWMV17_00709 [Acinetobacter calcoaceticus]|uniref:ACT domain-containing protein n=1 Tax=Acinetobacter calcoaceticus DSM 30006 = CIP 81.8 TaxID=981331 RepID=A0ABN0K5Z6_ACICA|nr:hypothetical protein [Acinetobacter calcoaceticus]ENV99033.1 hypothetical protein F936_02116 [Acinetobacter calcoaceticus DSM 30006 = CIP 81.8]CAI3111946.1 hypothetical protein MWMV17_MWMV17_00709 [Acinetobacter calcoaceticus]SUU55545.1 Uncharacterised protein [Acinetobacter calcoaceticus]
MNKDTEQHQDSKTCKELKNKQTNYVEVIIKVHPDSVDKLITLIKKTDADIQGIEVRNG